MPFSRQEALRESLIDALPDESIKRGFTQKCSQAAPGNVGIRAAAERLRQRRAPVARGWVARQPYHTAAVKSLATRRDDIHCFSPSA